MSGAVSGRLIGVGVGPGDPELLTLKAMRVLAEADVVAHFAKAGNAGNARRIVNGHMRAGVEELALLYPVIVWLARWLAASDGRDRLTEADVIRAVTLVDYQYSYAPYLSWRTRLLHQRNDIVRLCERYAC